MQHRWDDDQELLNDLGDALRESALAETIVEYGKGAYAWRIVDEDLIQASLTFAGEPVPELRSGPGDPRVLVFTAPKSALSMELEVTPGQVVGQIVPPGPGTIRVETTEGVAFDVAADDSGFFDLPEVPRGPVRMRCETPSGRLITDWVRL
jgi:hypothetical protein